MKIANLVLKDGVAVEEDVEEIDLTKITSEDPIAFTFGRRDGEKYKGKVVNIKKVTGSNIRDIANEYLRGFIFGYCNILLKEGPRILRIEFNDKIRKV